MQVCASSRSHACELQFSPHPEPRSCTPWPDSCTPLCPSLCDPGPLPQALQVHLLPGPTTPLLCRRGNQNSYERPTRSAAILVCLQGKSEGLPNSLGSNSRWPIASVRRLVDIIFVTPTIQRFWAQNPVEQSVTLLGSRLKACGMCMQCISVSKMINLLDDSY